MTALHPEALEENRAGRLSADQRTLYRAMSRGWRRAEVQYAAVFTVIGLLVWFADGPARYAAIKPLVGLAFLVLAGTLLAVSFLGADPVTRDTRAGRVLSADGAIRKWTQTTHSRSSSSTSHHAEVGKVTVEMGPQAYGALPEAGIVRLFYLPRSRRLVNFERLEDRPLPAGALTDRHLLAKDAVAGLFGSADARAELAAVGHAMQAEMGAQAAPPSAAERDPRPLVDALPGTWGNAMMSVTFDPGGSVLASLPGGVRRGGRWSVDASGRLVSDLTGAEGAADAWISAGALTIALDGHALVLRRVTAAGG